MKKYLVEIVVFVLLLVCIAFDVWAHLKPDLCVQGPLFNGLSIWPAVLFLAFRKSRFDAKEWGNSALDQFVLVAFFVAIISIIVVAFVKGDFGEGMRLITSLVIWVVLVYVLIKSIWIQRRAEKKQNL
jgi:hypothetical protein